MRLAIAVVVTLCGCERADRIEAGAPSLRFELREEMSIHARVTERVERPPTAPGAGWFRGLSPSNQENVDWYCAHLYTQPCWGIVHELGGSAEDSEESTHLAALPPNQSAIAHHCAQRYGPRPGCTTPLVISFDGAPIELAPGPGTFAFHPGSPVATDWPAASTPWLAFDRDGDSAITSGAELFGDATPLDDGTTAHDGFAALATLDTNHDGRIDREDPAFASLLLWGDRNGDRRSSPDELTPLAAIIDAIPLHSDLVPRCNARGDCEGARGIVTCRGRHTGSIVDVYLPAR
jgi:hypothetical protein